MSRRSDYEVSTLVAPTADDEILVLHSNEVRRVRLDHLAGSGVWVLPATGAQGPTGATGPTAIHVGDTAPVDTSLIWVDTSV